MKKENYDIAYIKNNILAKSNIENNEINKCFQKIISDFNLGNYSSFILNSRRILEFIFSNEIKEEKRKEKDSKVTYKKFFFDLYVNKEKINWFKAEQSISLFAEAIFEKRDPLRFINNLWSLISNEIHNFKDDTKSSDLRKIFIKITNIYIKYNNFKFLEPHGGKTKEILDERKFLFQIISTKNHIGKLNSTEIFRWEQINIPFYQRGYDWKKEQFWSFLKSGSDGGVLLFAQHLDENNTIEDTPQNLNEKNINGDKINQVNIINNLIDGQQRVMSVFFFFLYMWASEEIEEIESLINKNFINYEIEKRNIFYDLISSFEINILKSKKKEIVSELNKTFEFSKIAKKERKKIFKDLKNMDFIIIQKNNINILEEQKIFNNLNTVSIKLKKADILFNSLLTLENMDINLKNSVFEKYEEVFSMSDDFLNSLIVSIYLYTEDEYLKECFLNFLSGKIFKTKDEETIFKIINLILISNKIYYALFCPIKWRLKKEFIIPISILLKGVKNEKKVDELIAFETEAINNFNEFLFEELKRNNIIERILEEENKIISDLIKSEIILFSSSSYYYSYWRREIIFAYFKKLVIFFEDNILVISNGYHIYEELYLPSKEKDILPISFIKEKKTFFSDFFNSKEFIKYKEKIIFFKILNDMMSDIKMEDLIEGDLIFEFYYKYIKEKMDKMDKTEIVIDVSFSD